jgi:F0F1-type ATP synthase epsilon subunit
MELVVLNSYDTAAEANLILALLESNGLEAIVENDEDVLVNPGILTSRQINVKVLASELEKAKSIIVENQKAT